MNKGIGFFCYKHLYLDLKYITPKEYLDVKQCLKENHISNRECTKKVFNLIEENTKLKQEKENIIKYLEDKIKRLEKLCTRKGTHISGSLDTYRNILEKVKNG